MDILDVKRPHHLHSLTDRSSGQDGSLSCQWRCLQMVHPEALSGPPRLISKVGSVSGII